MRESSKAYSGFAVDEVEKARGFYGETLGFEVTEFPAGLSLNLPGDRDTLIYHKPDFTPATYTILNFEVPDIEAAVDQLTSHGIEMERYEGFDQDERGIARTPEARVGAWFTDPAGNILCVHEPMPS